MPSPLFSPPNKQNLLCNNFLPFFFLLFFLTFYLSYHEEVSIPSTYSAGHPKGKNSSEWIKTNPPLKAFPSCSKPRVQCSNCNISKATSTRSIMTHYPLCWSGTEASSPSKALPVNRKPLNKDTITLCWEEGVTEQKFLFNILSTSLGSAADSIGLQSLYKRGAGGLALPSCLQNYRMGLLQELNMWV